MPLSRIEALPTLPPLEKVLPADPLHKHLPLDHISNRLQGLPSRNTAERTSRLPYMSTIAEKTNNNNQLDDRSYLAGCKLV